MSLHQVHGASKSIDDDDDDEFDWVDVTAADGANAEPTDSARFERLRSLFDSFGELLPTSLSSTFRDATSAKGLDLFGDRSTDRSADAVLLSDCGLVCSGFLSVIAGSLSILTSLSPTDVDELIASTVSFFAAVFSPFTDALTF